MLSSLSTSPHHIKHKKPKRGFHLAVGAVWLLGLLNDGLNDDPLGIRDPEAQRVAVRSKLDMRPCADYTTLYADCSTRGVLLAKVNAEQCATIIKMFILVRTVDASKKRTWETGQKDVRYRYWITSIRMWDFTG